MTNSVNLNKREQAFVNRWATIRQRGKTKYMITRTLLWGFILFAVWAAVSLLEIYFSDFQRAAFTWPSFGMRCLIWYCCYQVIGFSIARGLWRGGENKYHYLT
ncbi:hypothetical protein [Paenibacillus sp. GCM10027626]|uniref:hypothetical protein n=1 Tax=Paenibacillus sp. GCM10027626 TaxID=3273411 RepID=UPI0036360A14